MQKVLYVVAEIVRLKDRAHSGQLEMKSDRLIISGPEQVTIAYCDLEELGLHRQNGVGTMIHAKSNATSVYFSVVRFNLFGWFAMVNYFKTRSIFKSLSEIVEGTRS